MIRRSESEDGCDAKAPYHTSSPYNSRSTSYCATGPSNQNGCSEPPTATVVPRPPSVLARVRPSLPPLACRPLTPLTPSLRHTLRPLSEVICASCGALHWIEERAGNTSKREPLFSTCCGKGKHFFAIAPGSPRASIFITSRSHSLYLLIQSFHDYANDNL